MWRLVLAALTSYVAVASACSCLPLHPQQQFCGSDFALRVKILPVPVVSGKTTTTPDPFSLIVSYTVKVIEVFKGPFKKGSIIQVDTAGNSAACGVNLLSEGYGTEWLITGIRSTGGKLEINSCGLNRVWSSLSAEIIKGLKTEYRLGCQCTVCSDRFCQEEGPQVCTYPQTDLFNCYIDDYCQPSHRGRRQGRIECSWSSCDQVTNPY